MEMNETEVKKEITSAEIENCIKILAQLVEDTNQIFDIPKEQRTELLKVAGMFSRPNRDEFSRRKKDAKKAAKRKEEAKNKKARKETGIRNAREASVFVAPKLLPMADLASKKVLEFATPRKCYVCKTEYTKMHHFYDSMCTSCGDFNYAKRFQNADVKGQIAVITGSRLKIGYHISLMLLRGGATVIA
ncbi:MAG: oxidoreductase, partial [Bacteroidetes bacterium]|nr:oxidoreductase [Bacteroidota bacterium]